jgi:uncharacterized membrane protein YdjX (TVP38/TMEM64 family)
VRRSIVLVISIAAGAAVALISREMFDSRAVIVGLGVITVYLVNGELGDIFGPKPPAAVHDPNAPPQPLLANPRVRRRLATVAALTAAAILVGIEFVTGDLDVEDVRQWILDLGAWGPILLISVLAIAMVIAPIPNPPFMIAAGIAWGTFLGVVYCVIGQLIGSMIIFVLSRKFGRRFIPRLIGAQAAERVDSLALRMGPHLVFWWRMMPISFDFAAYAAGLTKMRFRKFVVLTGIGSIIPTTVVVGFGNSFGKSWEAVLVTGLLVLVAVSVCAFFFYREFRDEIGPPRQAIKRFLGGESPV